MTDHVLVHVDELLAELADTPPCQDCTGRLGVAVFPDGEWHAVQVHDVPCPATARMRSEPPTLGDCCSWYPDNYWGSWRDVPEQCPKCGRKLPR